MADEELKKAMMFELEDHIPFKSNEIYFDYHILGEEPNAKNRMRVFLVATKKEQLEKKVELVRLAGLEPRLVTMDALALKNTLYFNYPSKSQTNITLLNIGDKITNILITREQIPYFVRDTHFGGDAITALLQTKLELDKKATEELKHNLKNATPEVTQIIKTALVNLLNEIFISLDFYENLTEQTIDEIYISGGTSQLFGLKEFLGGYLNSEIIDLDPFKNFSFSPNISQETLTKLSPYLAVAVGLALEES
jgi:type IV pilus assembly protein PilM